MILSPKLFATQLQDAPTSQLHEYLLSFERGLGIKPSLDVVKKFVKDGADVNAIGITGGNAVHLATESWSYSNYSEDMDPNQASYELIKIVEYLISLNSDHTIEDNRQLTGLYTAIRWGVRNPTFSKMFSILTKDNNNFNNSGFDGFTLAHLISKRRILSNDQLKVLIDGGLDLTRITREGVTIAHHAAGAIPKEGETLYLKELLSYIDSPKLRRKLSLYPMKDGNTPLHFAVRSKNLPAIKFLIENYQADPNTLNNSNRSPYSIAVENKSKNIKEYLEFNNARALRNQDELYCHKRNNFSVTYEKIVEVIKKCNIKKIKNLLKILPSRYLGQHTAAFFTLAAQDASPEYPQIFVYGEDGKTMMTFNGHHSQNGFSNLEFVIYRDKSKKFEMRDIRFPKNRNGEVSFSAKNPARCTTCHGQDPIPLWDTWTTWPGKFLGESSSRTPEEEVYYQKFLSNRNYGRYKYLPPVSFEPTKTYFEEIQLGKFANGKVDELLTGLMSQKIAKDLKNPKLNNYRYALLGVLSCSNPIEDFIPKKVQESFLLKLNYLEKDTIKKSANEMSNRIKLLEEIIPGGPKTRYVVQAKLFNDKDKSLNRAGRSRDIKRTSRLRYIIENLDVSMRSWFTPFNRGIESYMIPSWNGVEAEAWKGLLDESEDSKLYKTFQERRANFEFLESFNPFFYKTENESKVCNSLKLKSLAILSKE